MTRPEPPDVLIVGSANLDYVVRVAAPPAPGETVLADTLIKHVGGKGANQAVAAARMGANVRFVGCVGGGDGEVVLRELRSEGVDISGIRIDPVEPTGIALVSVYDSGENSIIVIPGANHAIDAASARDSIPIDGPPIVIAMQGETRMDLLDAVAAALGHHRLVVNLAPFHHVAAKTRAVFDPLIVNQSEATAMVGFDVASPKDGLRAIARLMESVRSCVVTLGAGGACWGNTATAGHIAAPTVGDVVDTTGAGDAFVGALVAELAAGAELGVATAVGVRAGSFSVQRLGAHASYPRRADFHPPLAPLTR